MGGKSLAVDAATFWAASLAVHPVAAVAADVVVASGAEILRDGEDVIGNEEGIAYVVEGGEAEDGVVEGADTDHAAEVEEGIGGVKLMEYIVEGGDADDEHCPDRGDKDAYDGRHVEGVEGWVVVEMAPHIGSEELDGGVEGRCRGYDEAEQ